MPTAAVIGTDARMMTALTSNTISEAVSNGVWLQVLQNYFLPDKFIIAPEQNNQTGRADLMVFVMHNDKNDNLCWDPIFTLEGKTPGDSIKQTYIDQASGYISSLASHHSFKGRKFGMLVAGQEVVLLVNNGGDKSTQWNWEDANTDEYKYNPGLVNVWGIGEQGYKVESFLADFAQKFQ
ncbi:hypothetical protein BDP55DRAFT_675245 [Colletotrichum godetiae]|uniref:Uncharacterized protein n=1 Tax=Colletotrichum godetiae TaxID=1209918 RepID=A0AAJ0ERV9_9PEZI|nr:uncharacterized protein BDP55DRAFT_675245 [Colletotrichum godetiae]KAK1671723.1 hypothetical protein BDP55DRAFT_675245 [Colletotrichum godetiae]